jgi:hypothetical protein
MLWVERETSCAGLMGMAGAWIYFLPTRHGLEGDAACACLHRFNTLAESS